MVIFEEIFNINIVPLDLEPTNAIVITEIQDKKDIHLDQQSFFLAYKE